MATMTPKNRAAMLDAVLALAISLVVFVCSWKLSTLEDDGFALFGYWLMWGSIVLGFSALVVMAAIWLSDRRTQQVQGNGRPVPDVDCLFCKHRRLGRDNDLSLRFAECTAGQWHSRAVFFGEDDRSERMQVYMARFNGCEKFESEEV